MRRSVLALSLALALGACSQAPTDEETTEADLHVEVAGDLGSPTLKSISGTYADEVLVLEEGNGPVINHDVPILYVVASFDDDRNLLAGGEEVTLGLPDTSFIDLEGVTEGSRLAQVIPQEGGAEIVVVDVLYSSAQGQSREMSGEPTIAVGEDGVPTLVGSGPVKRLSTSVSIRGDGEQVTAEDSVYVQYSLYSADDGALIDTTWGKGPIRLNVSGTMEGLRTGISESTVGSRLLIKIPAAQAQGTQDLYAIVDILAIG
ncbi:MAG: hypothetical protein QMB98_05345 [Flaviflexus sp.]|uniref:FKBP-type peptidyl-prolyl cis-trans isomerase n=1 Tax=Flaviflexus sp. TaxID=1969482 RepID=UPI00352C1D13